MAALLNPSFLLLAVGLVLTLGVFVNALRTAWRRVRDPERSWRPWSANGFELAFSGVVLLFLVPPAISYLMGTAGVSRLQGHPAPELVFEGLDGTVSHLVEHRGQVVLVNFWATWCPPCVHEMPALDRLQKTYGDQGLVVLNISDEPAGTIAAFLRKTPMTTRHGRPTSGRWPSYAVPTTYLVDREGIIRNVMVGARSFEQFERALGKFLD